jgi:hypothetical protein
MFWSKKKNENAVKVEKRKVLLSHKINGGRVAEATKTQGGWLTRYWLTEESWIILNMDGTTMDRGVTWTPIDGWTDEELQQFKSKDKR